MTRRSFLKLVGGLSSFAAFPITAFRRQSTKTFSFRGASRIGEAVTIINKGRDPVTITIDGNAIVVTQRGLDENESPQLR